MCVRATPHYTGINCVLPQQPGQQQQQQDIPEGRGDSERAGTNNEAAVTASPLWPEEVVVEDRVGQDTIEIALVFELAPRYVALGPREKWILVSKGAADLCICVPRLL